MNLNITPVKHIERVKPSSDDSPTSDGSTSCHSDHHTDELGYCDQFWQGQPYYQAHSLLLLPNNTESRNPKLKNELCRNFLRLGYCPYNNKCQFAHGTEELRQCQDHLNSKYKTKKCFAFFNGGFCEYGERCNFVHTAPKQNEQQKWRQIHRNYRELLSETRSRSRFFP